jgi:glutamine synthetase
METKEEYYLKEYYNLQFFPGTRVSFNDITNEQKDDIRDTTQFAVYMLNSHFNDVIKEISKAMSKIGMNIKQVHKSVKDFSELLQKLK